MQRTLPAGGRPCTEPAGHMHVVGGAAARARIIIRIIITSVVAGSVIVDFYIAPAEDGSALVEADDVTTAFVAGVSVAGATLTANSMASAPVS